MLNERKLTGRELVKREEAITGLLSNKRTLVKKYGKDAEKVMYGIATKQAKNKIEDMNLDKLKELIQDSLRETNKDENETNDALSIDTSSSGGANYGEEDKALGQEDELEMKGFEEGLNEANSNYPDFDLDKNIKYQDTSISSGMWRYTGKEQGGKGVYRNLMNDQFLGFSSDDFDFFKKHLGSHFDMSESLEENLNEALNPEVSQKVDQFIKGMAKRYSYSEQDAVFAIMAALKQRKFDGLNEDLDIGHQDDEPGMLKAELARAGQMIQMLYRSIDKYDDQGEVDFPQWWQAKIIKANAMLDSAFDYLDGKEMVAKIDAVIDSGDVNEGVMKDMHTYLTALRDSGVTNMFGASPYLQKEFGLDKKEARGVLANWMQSFSENLDEGIFDQYDALPNRGNLDFNDVLYLRGEVADLKDEIAQIYRDMEQEAEPEGGELANMYGNLLNKAEEKLYRMQKQLDDYDMNEGVNEELSPEDHVQIVRSMLVKAEKDGDDDLKRRALADMESVKKYYNLKEAMGGGQLFDYFANKGYVVKDRRPDGYPPKEGVEGYIVKDSDDSGKRRSNPGQMVIFQYNKDTDQFTISQLGGYSIDEKDAIKAGMREEGGSSVAGMDYYITDGNYTPVDISAEGLKDIVDHVMGGLSRETKRQKDFYAARGRTSGTIDEKISNAVKEKLTKKSSVEDHVEDFKDSDAPQFKGKSLKKIKQMALASFLSKQKK